MKSALWAIIGAGGSAAAIAGFLIFSGTLVLQASDKASSPTDFVMGVDASSTPVAQPEENSQTVQSDFITPDQSAEKLELARQAEEAELRNAVEQERLQDELDRQKEQAELQKQHYEEELRRQEYEQIVLLSHTNPLVKGLISDELNFYIQPVPSYAADGVSEAVEEVAHNLDGGTYLGTYFNRVYSEEDADLRVYWIKNIGSHVGVAIFKSHVEVGLGTDSCYGEWQPFDSWTVTKILWHELGHSLGFEHSSDSNNIMYYQTATQFAIDYDKSITLDEGYYYSVPFCKAGEYYYQMSGSDESNGFEVYVITPDTDPNEFITSQSGQYYPDCSGEESKAYITFSGSCSIPLGSKLLVYNKNDVFQFSAIHVDIKIIDTNEGDTPDMTWNMEDFEYDQVWLDEVQSLSTEFTS